MGVHILYDSENMIAALYCSTSDFAFGPVFTDREGYGGDERAESFCRWLKTIPFEQWMKYNPLRDWQRRDPRVLSDGNIERAYGEWLAQEAEQWKREETAGDEDSVA